MAMKAHVQPDPDNLRRLIDKIADHLGLVPKGSFENRGTFEDRQQALRDFFAHLEATEGARTSNDWQGAAIRLAGIRASSTTGISGALHNWITAAHRKIAQIAEAEAGKAGGA